MTMAPALLNNPRGVRLIERWLLPAFALLVLATVATWVVVGFEAIPMSATIGYFVVGAAGLAVLLVFGVAVAVVLTQSAIDSNCTITNTSIENLVWRLEEAGYVSDASSTVTVSVTRPGKPRR